MSSSAILVNFLTKDLERLIKKLRANEPVESTKVFLGGLPPMMVQRELNEFFESRYDSRDVIDSYIVYDPITCLSRCFGFVTFRTKAAADELILSGKVPINGRLVECKAATPLQFATVIARIDDSNFTEDEEQLSQLLLKVECKAATPMQFPRARVNDERRVCGRLLAPLPKAQADQLPMLPVPAYGSIGSNSYSSITPSDVTVSPEQYSSGSQSGQAIPAAILSPMSYLPPGYASYMQEPLFVMSGNASEAQFPHSQSVNLEAGISPQQLLNAPVDFTVQPTFGFNAIPTQDPNYGFAPPVVPNSTVMVPLPPAQFHQNGFPMVSAPPQLFLVHPSQLHAVPPVQFSA